MGDKPFVLNSLHPYLIAEYMEEAVKSYESPLYSPARMKANVYRLLTELGQQSATLSDPKYKTLTPAIRILEKDPLSDISVSDLAQICHISESSFRRLFTAYSGKSPIEYKIDLKIEKAKKMLENSDISIEQIAEILSFDSSAYFCRLFKKKTAYTPVQYREKIITEHRGLQPYDTDPPARSNF